MSDSDDPFTIQQLTELALMQAENAAHVEKALKATAHQAIAGLVINALLLHKLERLGLVDHDALREDAIARTQLIQPPEVGASVARVIKTIFDGEPPTSPGPDLTGDGSQTDAKQSLRHGDSTPSIMEKVRRRYIKTKRDDILLAAFNKLLIDMCERPEPESKDADGCHAGEVNLLLVLGPSGAGKTRSLKRLLSRHPALIPKVGEQKVLLSLSAPSPCGLKELGKAILAETGYTVTRTHVDGPEIWNMIRKRLPPLGVLIIHIDEAQHATQLRDFTERQKLLNSFKALMVDPVHPVAFILSGLPQVADFISMDEQVSRRAAWISIRSVGLRTDRAMLKEATKSFAKLAGLDVSADEIARLLPRLVHASDNRLGILVEEIHDAIRYALSIKASELTVNHFAKSFEERTGSLPQWNPYARSDYKAVDVWRMLATRDKPDPAVTKKGKIIRPSKSKVDRS